MSKEFLPEIVVKDTQPVENIHWKDCVLLLKIGESEIQLGIYREDTGYFTHLIIHPFEAPVAKENFKKEIEQLFSAHRINASQCKSIQFIIDTPLYTVIPAALYDEKISNEYFHFLYKTTKGQRLQTDRVKSGSLHVVYVVDEMLLKYASEFSNFSVIHDQTVLLNSLENKEKKQQVYITLYEQYVCILVFSDNKLLLAQSYGITDAMDAVYHILNVIQTLGLSAAELFLTGQHEKPDGLIGELQSRFSQVEWMERPEGGQFPENINQYPSHYFYHLVSLALCES